MSKAFLKLANGLISLAVAIALVVAGGYAAYCLWDNNQIYAAAENVQEELLHLKPQITEAEGEESGPTFGELLAINEDVRAWVTLDGTKIDHPVLQGETNLDYINTDVYGNFALAGSIFLDARNDSGFADPYSLLYGHHMENGGMFGDIVEFVNQNYFDAHTTGTLYAPGSTWSIELFACLEVDAYDSMVFNPTAQKEGKVESLLEYIRKNAVCYREIGVGPEDQIIGLSTCAEAETNGRVVIYGRLKPMSA